MRLKKVTLNNYRCFQHLEIDMHPQLTVLVGENGAGKTAILDGIAAGLSRVLRHLSSANQRLSAAGAGIKDTDFRIELWERRGTKQRVGASDYAQVIVETTQEGLQWDYWRRSSLASKEPPQKMGEAALARHIGRILEGFKTDEPNLLPVFSYYGAQRGRIEIPKRLRSLRENYSHPTSALVNALDSLSNFKEMLEWFDFEEASELRANKNDLGNNRALSSALETIRYAVRILLDGAYENPHFNADHKFVVISSENEMPLHVSQLSQGYQSMLALGMDFARRLALANTHSLLYNSEFNLAEFKGKKIINQLIKKAMEHGYTDDSFSLIPSIFAPAIMLVDEIDLHLHPSWQQRVLDDLMRAFPETQFIVTTHSPQVLTTVDADCIRILHNENNQQTGQIESWLETPTQQTRGVSSADVLALAMAVDPVPNVPESAWLSQYRAFIQQGLQDSPDGLILKEKLIGHFGPRHPEVLDCERMIRWEAFKQKLPSRSANS
ncbi:MAG: AAA family ATPase [Candidatus Methylumidiphilus sp.]